MKAKMVVWCWGHGRKEAALDPTAHVAPSREQSRPQGSATQGSREPKGSQSYGAKVGWWGRGKQHQKLTNLLLS